MGRVTRSSVTVPKLGGSKRLGGFKRCKAKKCHCQFPLESLATSKSSDPTPFAELGRQVVVKPTASEEKTKASELMLMSLGPKFFTNVTYDEDGEQVVTLDCSHQTIQSLMSFAYTGSLTLDAVPESTRAELLQLGKQLNIPAVVKICGDFISSNLTASNAVRSYLQVLELRCEDQTAAIKQYILRNFVSIFEQDPSFDELIGYLDDILTDDMLNVSEEVLFNILGTVAARNNDQLTEVAHLTKHVRYDVMSDETFKTVVLQSDFGANEIVKSSYPSYHPKNRVRQAPRIPSEWVVVVGGWKSNPNGPAKSIQFFNSRTSKWAAYEIEIPTKRAYHGLEVIGNSLFLFGGYDGKNYYDTTLKFDFTSEIWTEVCSMQQPLCYVSTTSHDNKLYVIGGFNGRERANSVECYDQQDNTWTILPTMNAIRSDATAVTYQDKIYAIGGFTGQVILNSVEVFDTVSREWKTAPSLNTARSGLSAIVYQDKIFALGGFNGESRLKTVECLDMANPARGWQYVAEMITPRSNFCVVVVDDKILVMGGFDGNQQAVTSKTETYSDKTQRWEPSSQLIWPMSAMKAVIIDA